MRTIKFRGRRIDNGEWVYGYFVGTTDSVAIIIPFEKVNYDVGYIGDSECCYCFPETIGQYSGLYDKNGSEIYEGDIIASEDYSQARHYVRYLEDEAMFIAMFIGSPLQEWCTVRQSWIDKFGKRIIGNIHDNPELLKGGAE